MSIDSWRAASTNAQVFTTTRSASSALVGRREPVGEERGDHLVGVDGVLRAAQGLDEERRLTHSAAGYLGVPWGAPGCRRTGSGNRTGRCRRPRSSSLGYEHLFDDFPTHPPGAALEAAMTTREASTSEAMPLERLEAEITELAGHLAAGECRWLRLIAEHDRRAGHVDAGAAAPSRTG